MGIQQIITEGKAKGGTGKYTFDPIERALRTGHAYLDNLYDDALAENGYIEMGITTEDTHSNVLRHMIIECLNEHVELWIYEAATYTQLNDGRQTNMNRIAAFTHPSVTDITENPTVQTQGYPILVQQWFGIDAAKTEPLCSGRFDFPIQLSANTSYIIRLTHLGPTTGQASFTLVRCECPVEE